MEQKIKKSDYLFFFVLYLLISIINISFRSYGADIIEDDGTYSIDFRYLPKYNTMANTTFQNLSVYESVDNPFDEDWTKIHTYTFNGSTDAVNIYSLIDKLNNHKYSLRCRVDDYVDVRTFKVQNMYVAYQFIPTHIIVEKLQIQGTVQTFIPDNWMSYGYTPVILQGRERTSGEWQDLKTYQVHYGEPYALYYYQEEGSFSFDAYRIYFNYWKFNSDGWTLSYRGEDSGNVETTYDICACDFYNTSENFEEKMAEQLEQLKELQDNTLAEIKNIGELITSLPDLILDGIYDLFVPEELGDTFSDYIDELLDKLGILGFPFQVIKYELEEITAYNPDSNIPIPDIEVMGHSFLQDYTFDMDSVGQINVDIINIKLITVVRIITAYLFAMALIGRVKVLLYDFGILKSPDDDIGGDV